MRFVSGLISNEQCGTMVARSRTTDLSFALETLAGSSVLLRLGGMLTVGDCSVDLYF